MFFPHIVWVYCYRNTVNSNFSAYKQQQQQQQQNKINKQTKYKKTHQKNQTKQNKTKKDLKLFFNYSKISIWDFIFGEKRLYIWGKKGDGFLIFL